MKTRILMLKCPICQDKLSKKLVSTKCGHVFCQRCLLTWLNTQNNCPTCRRRLGKRSAYHVLYLDNNLCLEYLDEDPPKIHDLHASHGTEKATDAKDVPHDCCQVQ
ncbi:E3 ubiquitin-protein ligase RNF4 [Eumeta japonica]|uniref:E3 ubiquitin-protein ligase RNF4 n=1 Tax=Eumeta variegata TaxID=151549 RepID=A0A4C1YJ37_EUMVA|nr:E3 ubiquitin-protein ligase RNF4 [Eumeta japonica]